MNRIRKGDLVEVIAGNDRGARGEVQRINLERGRVVVQGVNIRKKHQRATPGVSTQTGIIEFEAAIDASNVMPVCGSCDQPTRVGYQVQPNGRKVRVCRSCGKQID